VKTSDVEKILGRPQHDIYLDGVLPNYQNERVLITGCLGSIGVALTDALSQAASVSGVDIDTLDVRNSEDVYRFIHGYEPSLIFHLAGAKHAPEGELYPADVALTNVWGTVNVVDVATAVGAKVVLASTCKACDPETAYGASKLLAERIVLQAGGSVARFHNVVESSGNVFEIWEALPEDERIWATPCTRYFISLKEAVSLLIWVGVSTPGRYAVAPGQARVMGVVAKKLYPKRKRGYMLRRRGDRLDEPLIGSSETAIRENEWIMKITSPHEAAK
jgi:FlaA1/EpsC-like NDP-sugar epimerase